MSASIGDVVVLLPGITGSVLERDGREVWAVSPRALFNGVRTFGRSIRELAIANGDNPSDPSLDDGVRATRLMPDLHFLPGLDWKIDGYSGLSTHIKRQWRLIEGQNFFPFPYDWRRDNRASARQLQHTCMEWLYRWRRTQNPGAKLIFIAHSMGGLVARYFIEVLGGWEDTRALITIGTPFYGSLNALDFLVNGMRKEKGPFSVDLTPMLRSFTSVQQLVPVYKCVEAPGRPLASPVRADLPGWQEDWTEKLHGFFNEMESAARTNRVDPNWEEASVRFVPVVGTDQPTRHRAVLTTSQELHVYKGAPGESPQGDGTVPQISAALSGTEDVRMFNPERHASLQTVSAVLSHITGVVRSFGEGSIDALLSDDVRSTLLSWFSFDSEDIYLSDNPVTFDVALVTDLSEWQLPLVTASVVITNKDSGLVRRRDAQISREQTAIDVGSLPPGVYSIEIAPLSMSGGGSVRDVFVVVDGADDGAEDL